MGDGVATFVAAYTLITGTGAFAGIRTKPFVEKALRIGFAKRMAVTVVFPIGLTLDLFPGMIAAAISERHFHDSHGFAGTFLTTLLQGIFLNAILLGYIWIVYAILYTTQPHPPSPVGYCQICQYDLRGTPERCRECGTWVKHPSQAIAHE